MATTPLREALHGIETEITAGRPGEALRLCDQLLVTHPRWLDAQRLRARALVAVDRLPEAERVLDGILASNPEDGAAFCDRAYLMQRRGELLGALACYRRACELVRNNAGLRAAHNQLAAQLGRPPYTPSHTGLARLYLRAELFAHALREWDIALHANPNRLDAQIGMAETLWRSGDSRRAQTTSRFILGQMPLSLKPLLLLAFFNLEDGRPTEAQNLVRLAGELDPDQQIAGELFGDLVAAGHSGLAQLFRAAVRSKTSPLLAPESIGQTGVFPALVPRLSRPISEPLPTGQLPTGPLFTPKPDFDLLPTGKLSYPPVNGNGEIEDFFSQSRASMMPDNFDVVFRETEYMLWSRDNEEPTTAEIPAITPTTPPPSSEETDMAFVRWLQEQGARPLDDAPPAVALPALPPSTAPDAPVEVPPFLRQALSEATDLPALPPAPAQGWERANDNAKFSTSDAALVIPPAPWLVGTEAASPATSPPALPPPPVTVDALP
ncbi:MAG: tetratricopeptide repeat protein, partial [Ktedonobacterales bacterium]|nr:tetratricopeptide repeat protein [Ktedonobacterales bacterium]